MDPVFIEGVGMDASTLEFGVPPEWDELCVRRGLVSGDAF
jgi:hypothetical protein